MSLNKETKKPNLVQGEITMVDFTTKLFSDFKYICINK